MTTHPLIIVCGLPRGGKTTFARLLSAVTGIPHGDTSQIVYEEYALRHGMTVREAMEIPKENIRQELVGIGDQITEWGKSCLVRALWDRGCGIISGVRRVEELAEARVEWPGLYAVWIERKGCERADNTTVWPADCDRVIPNISGFGGLMASAIRLDETIRFLAAAKKIASNGKL